MMSPSIGIKRPKKQKRSLDDPCASAPAAEGPVRERGGASHDPVEQEEEEAPTNVPSELNDMKVEGFGNGKAASRAEVPDAPPTVAQSSVISDVSTIAIDESYGEDEKALNQEATSSRTLQLLSDMIGKSAIQSTDLICVPKTHDDMMLTPPNDAIGERPCINGERCLAKFIAQVRYGGDTDKAFVCKEFLLPDQHSAFLAGKGLPQRRGKCLLCTRYFQHYTYILARTDPNFRVGETPIGTQVFCNAVAMPKPKSTDEAELQEASKEVPTHCSSVSTTDGYLPSAMLFVDEEFVSHRCAREDRIAAMTWRPCVRFCSSHYKYIKDRDGLRIVQVGIGVDSHTGSHFPKPPAVAAPEGATRPKPKSSSVKRL